MKKKLRMISEVFMYIILGFMVYVALTLEFSDLNPEFHEVLPYTLFFGVYGISGGSIVLLGFALRFLSVGTIDKKRKLFKKVSVPYNWYFIGIMVVGSVYVESIDVAWEINANQVLKILQALAFMLIVLPYLIFYKINCDRYDIADNVDSESP